MPHALRVDQFLPIANDTPVPFHISWGRMSIRGSMLLMLCAGAFVVLSCTDASSEMAPAGAGRELRRRVVTHHP
jgi:hypothetical protein